MNPKWMTRGERRGRTASDRRRRNKERRLYRLWHDSAYAMREAEKRMAANERRRRRRADDPEYAAKLRKDRREADKLRRAHDPGFDMMLRLRKRLRRVLCGERKAASALRLVGCSHDALRSHIESKFLPGMTWENRRMWHIDHIRPCASFDLSRPSEQAACFHYANLQPLWAKDNLAKGAKY